MNRNLVYVVGLALIISACAGGLCADTGRCISIDAVEFEKFESPEGKFSVCVPHGGDYTNPTGWERTDSFPYKIDDTVNGIMLEGPTNKDRAKVKIAVLYYAGKGIKSVDHYIRKVLFFVEKKPEFSVVEVAGKKAKSFTFDSVALIILPFTPPAMKDGIVYELRAPSKEVPVIDRYIVIPAAPGFYSLWYEVPQDLYEEYAPVFDAVVKSFKCQQK